MKRRVVLAALAWLAASASALAQVQSVELQPPRAFGYFAGNIIRLEAIIATDPGTRPQAASLPRPRTLRPWLDLRAVLVEAAGPGRYRARFDYQTLDAPLEAVQRSIPSVTLTFETPGGTASAVIPAWAFVMSPLRGLAPIGEAQQAVLMPDIAPRLSDTDRFRLPMAATALGSLLCLGLLARHHAWWPFRRRAARPFTIAERQIHRLAATPPDAAYRASLLALHRAFDAAHGKRVFATDLDGFVTSHPHFDAARDDIARFFAASRRAFFAEDISGASGEHPIEAVSALSHRLSQLERAAS
ncbi:MULTISPECIES: hypothetical protein [Rhodomicrobium]|uniref:hypothetical protein n=1 Tax=Rhodomicrobium TaxID=1068 RepID=UPI000B4BB879|nr:MULTISPECIES: hypothetical protein [Rhodomicrobium]